MSGVMNVLLIGVGGNVSQGVLKALALCKIAVNIVVAGVEPMDYGLHTGYRGYICPWASDPQFKAWLIDTCKKEHIHAVLTGAEPVISFLAEHRAELEAETGSKLIVSDADVIATGDDKLKTCEWLNHHGFHCPDYARSDDAPALVELAERNGYPLIAKPRRGGGSRGLFVVRDGTDLEYAATRKGYIVQQCVGTTDSEFTVGCFCDRDGVVRGTISLRRHLHEGTTFQATAGDFPQIDAVATSIVTQLKPRGPCNIQCRVHEGNVYCFEINVRFSGTTPIRARFGFNEVEASLRDFVLGEPVTLPRVTSGTVVRYINELYLDPAAVETLRANGQLTNPDAYSPRIEDFGANT